MNSYQIGNGFFNNQKLVDSLSGNEKEKLANNTMSNVWYIPDKKGGRGKHFASATPQLEDLPAQDKFLMDQELFEKGQGIIRGASLMNASSTVIDKAMYSPFSKEALPWAVEWYDTIEKIANGELRRGAAITGGHPNFADIRNVVLSGEVVEWINREAILMESGSVIRTQYLKVDVDDIIKGFEATPGLQDLEVSEQVNIEYDRITFKLKKIQCRASYSRWISNYVFDHDPIQDIMTRLDLDIPLQINKEIATTLLATAGVGATGTYDSVVAANFHYTTNPTIDFVADKTAIFNAGGKRDRMAMNDKTKTFTFQNSYLRAGGPLGPIQAIDATHSHAMTHPLLKDTLIYVDEQISDGIIEQFDSRTLLIGDGPMSTRSYTKELEFIAGRVIDKWEASKIRNSSVIKERTGCVT